MSTDSSPPKDQSKYLSKLDGKRVLVLGGTSGIGFCIAEAAVEHNAHVVISSSSPEKVAKTLDRLRTAYPSRSANIRGKTCDLSDPATLEAELKALFEFAGKGIAHVAFTAGGSIDIKPIADVSPEYLQNPNTVRFIAPIVLAKIAPAYLLPGPESSITFTGGNNSVKPFPGVGVMSAFGASLEGLTRGMAQDLKPVRVNLISPGLVDTEAWDLFPKEYVEKLLGSVQEKTLGGEIGRPEDVAEAYLYLMKDRFITGKVIRSDGGGLLT
ncbi:hypothetical protein MMC22_005935 [Lobaria immixta]|nr:hypothetical protein [Lobaria immixta]